MQLSSQHIGMPAEMERSIDAPFDIRFGLVIDVSYRACCRLSKHCTGAVCSHVSSTVGLWRALLQFEFKGLDRAFAANPIESAPMSA